MPAQEAELIRQFRRNPPDAQVMLVEVVKQSADLFHAELDEVLECIAQVKMND